MCVSDSYRIEVEKLFDDPSKDLEKIESIIDNPYFYDFLENMYSDYSGFMKFLPYIDFKTIDYYYLGEVLCENQLFESKKIGGKSAITNGKILTKTREVYNKTR